MRKENITDADIKVLQSLNVAPLELERPGELRIFCLFYGPNKDKTAMQFRLTESDSLFCNTVVEGELEECISKIISSAIEAGGKVDMRKIKLRR